VDSRLLRYYSRELQHLRESAGQFAKDFPKIAGRLGVESLECADPYVERLLEGFAFLTARVQLKFDSEFPRLTHSLLETVYPNYVAPTPSMALVQFEPDLAEGSLVEGFEIPRGSVLRSRLGKGDQTPCEYRTAHDVTLWPVELTELQYYSVAGATGLPEAVLGPREGGAKAALRLRLSTVGGLTFNKLAGFDRLAFFVDGTGEVPANLHEHLLTSARGIAIRSPVKKDKWCETAPADCVRQRGFADDEALLPSGARSFHGYRLLHEYFAFPHRYRYVEIGGMSRAAARHKGREIDVFVLLDEARPDLERGVDPKNLAPYSTPAVNLFPRRADRIHLSDRHSEFQVIPDRTRPLDFEVYQVSGVTGFGQRSDFEQQFLPFYSSTSSRPDHEDTAYFAVHRVPRTLSQKERRQGPRSRYLGSDVYVSLVDSKEAPYSSSLRQLAVSTLCTNRDLPLHMPVGKGTTDFTLDAGAPIVAARCLKGPTAPTPAHVSGDLAWRLISHLSLNYLSLVDSIDLETGESRGAEALRDLLKLYGDVAVPEVRRQIDGLRSISTDEIVRRSPRPWPVGFVRGLEITTTLDEPAFEGTGVFLLGSVLEQFFAKYVSLNSFTEMVLRTQERGEIKRWPSRIGARHVL